MGWFGDLPRGEAARKVDLRQLPSLRLKSGAGLSRPLRS